MTRMKPSSKRWSSTNKFTEPLAEREVVKATKSAEKAWAARSNAEANRIAREKGYSGAGYNITNKKLIQWLGITKEDHRKSRETPPRGHKAARGVFGPGRKKRRKSCTYYVEY